MKKQYFINANILDPHNSINEVGGLIISGNEYFNSLVWSYEILHPIEIKLSTIRR